MSKLFFRLQKYAVTLWVLFWNKKTPKISKFLLAGAFIYLLIPFDFVPDFIPFAGLIDEAILIPLLIKIAMMFVPQDLKDQTDNKSEKKLLGSQK